MQNPLSNITSKIWAFMDSVIKFTIVINEEKQLTVKLENQ